MKKTISFQTIVITTPINTTTGITISITGTEIPGTETATGALPLTLGIVPTTVTTTALTAPGMIHTGRKTDGQVRLASITAATGTMAGVVITIIGIALIARDGTRIMHRTHTGTIIVIPPLSS